METFEGNHTLVDHNNRITNFIAKVSSATVQLQAKLEQNQIQEIWRRSEEIRSDS